MHSYLGRLPLSRQKFDDVNALALFCGEPARYFFENLPNSAQVLEDGDEDGQDAGDFINLRVLRSRATQADDDEDE